MKRVLYTASIMLSVLSLASHAQASYDSMDELGSGKIRLQDIIGGYCGYDTTYVPVTSADALREFVKPCAGTHEMSQFRAPLKWYRPTPEELEHVSSLGFASRHLGAALRMRAHINRHNADLYQSILKGCDSDEAQNLLPAAMGLTRPQLIEAAEIQNTEARLQSLRFAPRSDAWVYGMLGADPAIDDAIIDHAIRMRIEENPDRMSAFFIRNLKEGADLTRQRITGFLLEASFLTIRAEHLGYGSASNVMHALNKKHMKRPFGRSPEKFPFSEGSGRISFVEFVPDCFDPMPKWTYTPSTYLNPLP